MEIWGRVQRDRCDALLMSLHLKVIDMNISPIAAIAATPSLAAFTVNARAVYDALTWLRKSAYEPRNTIAILSQVRIEASADNVLTINSTDLDQFGTVTIAAAVDRPGLFFLPLETLQDFTKSAPQDCAMTVRDRGDRGGVELGAGSASIVMRSLDRCDADWPWLERADCEVPLSVEMSAEQWALNLALVSPAISKEETRYYLRGIFMHGEGNKLKMAATDGHRLSVAELPVGYEGPDCGWILPASACSAFALMVKGGDVMRMVLHATWGEATAGNMRLRFKAIDGTFPNYSHVIPTLPDECPALAVQVKEMLIHCKSAVKMKGEKSRALTIEGDDGSLCAGRVGDQGFSRPLSGEYQGPEFALTLDAGLLEPLIKLHGRISIQNSQMAGLDSGRDSPNLIRSPDAPDWLAVIMPLRNSGELPKPRAVDYVETKAAPGRAADLFSIEKAARITAGSGYSDETLSMHGVAPGPRKASTREVLAYAVDYAKRLGHAWADCEGASISATNMHSQIVGVTFGEKSAASWDDGKPIAATYHDGALSVLLPGYGQDRIPVTIQTMDGNGDLSQPMPCLDAKGSIAMPDAPKGRKAKGAKAKGKAPKGQGDDCAPMPRTSP